MRRWLRLIVLAEGLCLGTALAQHPTDSKATALPEVQVRGFAPERFLVGQKFLTLDSAAREQGRYQTLADWLSTQLPIGLKSYGPGQTATVGLRGTAAVHTAVLWNGIPINSPTLGQSDVSTLPLAGLDRLSVQYGAASSVFGSGAVAGSVLVQTLPDWEHPGWNLSVGGRTGSFANGQVQGVARYTTALKQAQQLSVKIAAYRGWVLNRTPYAERRGYPVEASETMQQGVLGDLFLKNNRHQFSLNTWLSDTKNTVAPADSLGREVLRTASARVLAGFETGGWQVKAGWLRDLTEYGKGANAETAPSRTLTDRLLVRVEREQTWKTRYTLRIGGEVTHYIAQVDEYIGSRLHETRTDVYALFRVRFTDRLLATLNLRQAFVTGFNPKPTPSLGGEYAPFVSEKNRLTLKGSVAFSYRVPTLNERYWKTLGNSDLRPEQGFSQEAGVVWQHQGNLALTTEITAFRNLVNNWTYWNPERGYRVENLQQVLARGLEVSLRGQTQWGKLVVGLNGQYALTHSTQQQAYSAYSADVVGKQLPYIPMQSGAATLFTQRGKHRLSLRGQVASRRFTTFDNSQFQKGYFLTDVLLDTALSVRKAEGRLSFQILNVFDELLLSVKGNAQPGRSFNLNLTFNFSSNP